MAGYLLTATSTVQCVHGGTATAATTSARVRAGSQGVVAQSATHTVAGCPYMTGPVYTPCVSAQWTTGASRVRAGGEPVLLQDSQATTTPNGTGLIVANTQTRVKAT